MRKRPRSSVTAVRTFSMSAGLDASTDTPGMTAPEVSRAEPAMDACANADAGRRVDTAIRSTALKKVRIARPPVRVAPGEPHLVTLRVAYTRMDRRDRAEMRHAKARRRGLIAWARRP